MRLIITDKVCKVFRIEITWPSLSTMNTLPPEITENILRYLPIANIRYLRIINKQWRNICCRLTIYNSIIEDEFKSININCQTCCAYYTNLDESELHIRISYGIDNIDLAKAKIVNAQMATRILTLSIRIPAAKEYIIMLDIKCYEIMYIYVANNAVLYAILDNGNTLYKPTRVMAIAECISILIEMIYIGINSIDIVKEKRIHV